MYLEILTHLQANVLGQIKLALLRPSCKDETTRHRQVEGVESSLECHDPHVCLDRVFAEIHLHTELVKETY